MAAAAAKVIRDLEWTRRREVQIQETINQVVANVEAADEDLNLGIIFTEPLVLVLPTAAPATQPIIVLENSLINATLTPAVQTVIASNATEVNDTSTSTVNAKGKEQVNCEHCGKPCEKKTGLRIHQLSCLTLLAAQARQQAPGGGGM